MSLTPKIWFRVAMLASLPFITQAPARAQLNSTSSNSLNNTTSSVQGAGNTSCGTSVAGCSGLTPPNVNISTEGTGGTAAGVGNPPPTTLTPNGEMVNNEAPGAVGALPPSSIYATVPGTVAGPITNGIAPTPGLNTTPSVNSVGIGNNGLGAGAGAPTYSGLGGYSPGAPATGAAMPGAISPPGTVNTPLASNGAVGGSMGMMRSAGR